jgi:hypothetical protein
MEITELCPWCNSVISRVRFLEIEAKIRTEEQKKLAASEELMRSTLQAQFAAEFEKRYQAGERKFRAEADKAIAKVSAERDAAARELKNAAIREAEIRRQAREEAAKITAKEMEKQNARLEKITAERDAVAKELKDRESSEVEIRKQVKAEADKVLQKELRSQREAVEKERDSALLKKQAEFNRERFSWEKKFKSMERQIQKRTANQLGEGAEIDLYETLREVFKDDHTTRVAKGQNGADLHLEVRYKGQRCGLIVIDSKNRQSWKNEFLSKLREDQIKAGADHAILSSTVFPGGEKEVCFRSDVMIVNPARVVYMVEVFRRSIISMHLLGLSMKERTGKTNQLYKLITSDSYMQRFRDAMRLTDEILAVDVEEQKAHTTIWRNRGTLVKRMANLLHGIDTDVAAVTEGGSDPNEETFDASRVPPATTSTGQRREAI